jgi:hypothetical protein
MKFLNFFFTSFFALLDPDPDSESGSADLIESGSTPHPPSSLKTFSLLADIPYMNLAGEDLKPDRNATVIALLVN